MGSLLSQINAGAEVLITENEIISNNIDLLAEYLSMSANQLNEAVGTWLALVRNRVSKGELPRSSKNNVIKILGALDAISNEDLADALDDKGDMGAILWDVGDKDKTKSEAALQRLLAIGNEPSLKKFVQHAASQVENSEKTNAYTMKIHSNIERVMNKRRGKERRDDDF